MNVLIFRIVPKVQPWNMWIKQAIIYLSFSHINNMNAASTKIGDEDQFISHQYFFTKWTVFAPNDKKGQ